MLNIKEKVEGLGIANRKVAEIQSALSDVTEKAMRLSNNMETLESRMSSLEDKLASQEASLERLSASADASLKRINEAAALMSSETAKFVEERKKFSEQILTRVADGLSREISEKFSRLKDDGERYAQLASSLSQTGTEVLRTKNELEKFNRIAEKVRSSDFEMSALANKIEQLSIRNNSLHNQLERMQHAISNERRHPRAPPY